MQITVLPGCEVVVGRGGGGVGPGQVQGGGGVRGARAALPRPLPRPRILQRPLRGGAGEPARPEGVGWLITGLAEQSGELSGSGSVDNFITDQLPSLT